MIVLAMRCTENDEEPHSNLKPATHSDAKPAGVPI
jgi:hypothetical protein